VRSAAEGRFRWALLGVALAAIVLRVAVIGLWSSDLGLAGDQEFYHHQANDLAEGVGYTYRHPVGERITTAAHPPLHPSLLGAASLVGASSPTSHRLVGTLLGAAAVVIAGLAARRMAGCCLGDGAARGAGLAAAAVVAVAPTLWINDSQVLSESSYSVAIALVLLAGADLIRSPRPLGAVALGVAVGLAVLARAEALVLVGILVVPLAWVVGRRAGSAADPPGERWWRRPAVLFPTLGILAAGVVMAPWVVRNLTSFESPVVTSSGPGWVIEIANCDETYYGDRLGYWAVECDRTPWEPGDETATEQVKRAAGLRYAADNASRLPVVVAARVARMFDVWRPGESVAFNDFYERRGRVPSMAAIGVWWGMLGAGAAGVWALRRRLLLVWPVAAVAASTTFAAAASFGITRYRSGLEVAMAVLAGIGLAFLAAHVAARRTATTGHSDPGGSQVVAASRAGDPPSPGPSQGPSQGRTS